MKKILKYWLSEKIPDVHMKPNLEGLSKKGIVRAYIVHWCIHPVKRRLAKYYCLFLQKCFGLKVIGITGSSGKSTTKEMLASVLKQKFKVVYSYANIDPIYNIPTTILKCTPLTKYLILEMGVEYPDEMDFYLWMVKPDYCIITLIYPTHTEFFKNIEGVYKEKIKLADEVVKKGKVILNYEDELLRKYKANINNVIYYGEGSKFSARKIDFKLNGSTFLCGNKKPFRISLPTIGKANVDNSLAVISISKLLGIDNNLIKKGLNCFKPLEHRLSIIRWNNAVIFDDTYNSNPQALKEALEIFNFLSKGRDRIVVIGDMLELGDLSKKYHQEISEELLKSLPGLLICVGENSKIIFNFLKEELKNNIFWVKSQIEVDVILKKKINSNSAVLLKASHSIALDKVVDRLFK